MAAAHKLCKSDGFYGLFSFNIHDRAWGHATSWTVISGCFFLRPTDAFQRHCFDVSSRFPFTLCSRGGKLIFPAFCVRFDGDPWPNLNAGVYIMLDNLLRVIIRTDSSVSTDGENNFINFDLWTSDRQRQLKLSDFIAIGFELIIEINKENNTHRRLFHISLIDLYAQTDQNHL